MMKERKEIQFSHPQKGTVLLTINDVSLPKRIRESIDSVENVRFNYIDFELDEATKDIVAKPLFFEWQKIDILFSHGEEQEFKPPFKFYINKDQTLSSNFINGRHLISGSFALKNAVGYTSFSIEDSKGEEVFKLNTEVFPQKLEYKEDFQEMIYDITKIIYNLIYDYLQKTYTSTALAHHRSASLIEWRAILEVLFDALERSIDHIIKNPKSEVESRTTVREVSRVRRTSKGVQKWMLKNQRYLSLSKNDGVQITDQISCSHLPETRKRISYNTFENRFVVWAIKQIISKLDDLTKYLKKSATNPKKIEKELRMLKDFRLRLRRRLSVKFLRDVEDFENQFHFSTVLTMAPGYKDFYHKYLLLRKALSVFDDDQFKMDYKDIATLYEYWCFLKIVHLLKENPNYNLVSNDLIRVKGSKFIVSLKQGKESKFVFEDKDSKEQYQLFFNRSFTARDSTYTYTQRPDYSIQFKKEGYDNPFWYVLDAKYRFNRDDNPASNKSSYDAPDDAIGQLHRYRDAILHERATDMTYRSAIKNLGGLILYPYPKDEESFIGSRYYKSIEQVNIGAMPFAPGNPGKHELFKEFLSQLFKKTPESLHEEIVHYNVSSYDAFIKKLETICIIGLIKEEDFESRKDFYLSKGMYNVRFVKNPNAALYKAKRIALYSPVKKAIIGFAPINKIEIETKEALDQKGVDWNLGQKQYAVFYFNPSSWESLSLPFKGKPLSRGYRYANLFAFEEFRNTEDINAINLNDFNSIRLWKELKARSVKVEIIRGQSFKTKDGLDKTSLIFKLEEGLDIQTDSSLSDKWYYVNGEKTTLEKIIERLSKKAKS